jgi:H+/Cl- antiporter ClcA
VTTATTGDPAQLLRSRQYVQLLVLAALLGIPISAMAYGFLTLVSNIQTWVYDDLPSGLGFGEPPAWWPLPVLGLAGVLVGLTIRYLPGNGGHPPSRGFEASAPPTARELPGVAAAAVIGLGLGVVLGPEAPLIALGGGLAVLPLGRGRPRQVMLVVAATGSFAAIATLLGSPIVGAFLLMETIGIGGAAMGMVLIPGLLAAGVGSLVFLGLGQWTGLGTQSLTIPNLPTSPPIDLAQVGWAVAIGAAGAVVGVAIRRLALVLAEIAREHVMLVTPMMGLVIAALAIIYRQVTDRPTSDVLFSGQTALGPLLTQSASYSVGTLVLLLLCKGLAYTAALGSFRGGPIFPSMFLGAAGGVALSHLPGLPTIAGASMGIVAMCVTLLRLPLTAVLLTALFLGNDGIRLTPVIIVSAVVAYVVSAWLSPPNPKAEQTTPAPPSPPAAEPAGAPTKP